MIEQIEKLLEEIKSITANNAEELEALRLKYLSKKGILNNLMAQFREVPAEQKKEFGMKLNELKNATQEKINSLKEALESKEEEQCELDLTRPGYPVKLGTRHPLSIVKNEIVDIFARLGFSIANGVEVEDDWHVFSAMNFADDHPARDMQDTFFVEAHPDIILRTHTSSVQSRDGDHTTTDTHHCPRTRISQRGHQLSRTLFLPPARSIVHRQKRIVHRPQTSASSFR